MPIIYYVGSRLSPESAVGLCGHFDLPSAKFHSTLAYSREWFTYKDDKPYPIIIDPPFEIAQFAKQTVLLFRSPELAQRWQEFRAAGATWDYPDHRLHITLGKHYNTRPPPTFPLVFDKEYYGTWME
jgi:hypothetical protein